MIFCLRILLSWVWPSDLSILGRICRVLCLLGGAFLFGAATGILIS